MRFVTKRIRRIRRRGLLSFVSVVMSEEMGTTERVALVEKIKLTDPAGLPGQGESVEQLHRASLLDERAVVAVRSDEEMERLIEDYRSFLRSRVYRYSTHCDNAQREEMYGTAMLAFYESVKKYDPSKGHFFPFSNRIVCERLIDYNRRVSRHDGHLVSLEDEDTDPLSAQSAAVTELSIRSYETTNSQAQLVEEIEQFKEELAGWGISMASLAMQSPRHKKLREDYRMVVTLIAQTPDIIQTIQLKRYFPIKAVAKISGIPPKKLERARNFILASLIIKMGDYDYLSEYVNG